jgi:hypothetical protein
MLFSQHTCLRQQHDHLLVAAADAADAARTAEWQLFKDKPELFTDNRTIKEEGRVKATFPDFKTKKGVTPEVSLWRNPQAEPKDLDAFLAELDLPHYYADIDARWDDLLAHPENWLDNRELKASTGANLPDFKHADNGAALYLNSNALPTGIAERVAQVAEALRRPA